jgi:hypothetical protein
MFPEDHLKGNNSRENPGFDQTGSDYILFMMMEEF